MGRSRTTGATARRARARAGAGSEEQSCVGGAHAAALRAGSRRELEREPPSMRCAGGNRFGFHRASRARVARRRRSGCASARDRDRRELGTAPRTQPNAWSPRARGLVAQTLRPKRAGPRRAPSCAVRPPMTTAHSNNARVVARLALASGNLVEHPLDPLHQRAHVVPQAWVRRPSTRRGPALEEHISGPGESRSLRLVLGNCRSTGAGRVGRRCCSSAAAQRSYIRPQAAEPGSRRGRSAAVTRCVDEPLRAMSDLWRGEKGWRRAGRPRSAPHDSTGSAPLVEASRCRAPRARACGCLLPLADARTQTLRARALGDGRRRGARRVATRVEASIGIWLGRSTCSPSRKLTPRGEWPDRVSRK